MPAKHHTLLVSPDPGETSWVPVGPPIVGTGQPDGQVITPTDAGGLVPGKLSWRIMVAAPLTDSDGDELTDFEEFLLGSDPFTGFSTGTVIPVLWSAKHLGHIPGIFQASDLNAAAPGGGGTILDHYLGGCGPQLSGRRRA